MAWVDTYPDIPIHTIALGDSGPDFTVMRRMVDRPGMLPELPWPGRARGHAYDLRGRLRPSDKVVGISTVPRSN
jgi:hypothetical protein